MKRIQTALFVTLIAASLATEPVGAQTNKDLDAKVVAAWKAEGFEVGWYVAKERSSGQFSATKSPGAVPAFRAGKLTPGSLSKLPAPGVPFALDFSKTFASDQEMKDIAKLDNLQMLNADRTGITDAGLTTIAGFKKLQFLSIRDTNVTGKGVSRLSGQKSLKTLVITTPIGTIAGIANAVSQLSKTRPDLKLVFLD